MFIEVNGESHKIDGEKTVSEFLRELGANAKTVIVELNQSILEQNRWSGTFLKENDKMEIISFVGGG